MATRQKTVTTPAKPAVTKTVSETICDCCETREAKWTCNYCERDVCKSCSSYDPAEHGDYPGRICKHCNGLSEKCRSQIQAVEADADTRIDAILKALKAESLAATATEEA